MTIAQQLNVKEFPFIIKNSNNNIIYYENKNGFWWKAEHDLEGNEIYWEDSYGTIIETQPEMIELTLDEIADKFNIDVKLLKIK